MGLEHDLSSDFLMKGTEGWSNRPGLETSFSGFTAETLLASGEVDGFDHQSEVQQVSV